MNAYGLDLSLLDYGMSGQILEYLDHESPSSPSYSASSASPTRRPPSHRHDGTSPLPLGMDWSPPPRKWDGRDTVWPHDPHTGWSYCVTIPSWTILPSSRGSGPVVFYRVQVGIQTPEAITTTRSILHRFSDFLKLFSELRKSFPVKIFPVPPPRKLLGSQSKKLIEERRLSLEDWMDKLLSNIDISRSAPVAIFLELEAAVRLSFHNFSGNDISSLPEHQPRSDISVINGGSSIVSDYGYDTACEKSEIGIVRHGEDSFSDIDLTGGAEMNRAGGGAEKDKAFEVTFGAVSYDEDGKAILAKREDEKVTACATRLSTDSEVNSLKAGEISNWEGLNFFEGTEMPTDENMQFPNDLIVALPSEQRHKFSRVLVTMQQRLATAKADMEDLVARLNQELTVRQYLTTKVKDLEVELETTKENTKENLQQAISIEKERSTQMQWDLEEFRKKCLEMELKLKAKQDEKARMESENLVVIQENEMLVQELDAAREQLQNLQKHHEESEVKSKTDVKVLVKEVKSLRSSQSEVKQELSKLMKEKLELERLLRNEKQRREQASSVNEKLLHECAILQKRLLECSVNFKVEVEDKLIVDASSPSDALDLLTVSDNRIGLLLAEAQLLAQDVENSVAEGERTTENELIKMLTNIFIDNATARKQINSVIRCALDLHDKPEKHEEEEEEEAPSRDSVLSKFL